MNADIYKRWVIKLAAHEPYQADFDAAYEGMAEEGVSMEDRVDIAEAASKLHEERRRSAEKTERLAKGYGAGVSRFMDGYDDPWGPTGRYGRDLPKYGRSPAMDALGDLRMYGNAFIKFNTEGEKRMEKIDWHKPLRTLSSRGKPLPEKKVYTYKSGKQRVVWIDERVYPVDDHGCAVATIQYPGYGLRRPGQKIVENVPEEKFFLGLGRNPDGTYWLTDGGAASDMGTMNSWKTHVANCWIVDTRKSAEPPKAIVHDPEDYVTIYAHGGNTFTSLMMTKAKAEAYVSEPGEQVVRVRITPAPADTSRYVQLFRRKGSNEPWRINAFSNRQEITASEIRDWKAGCGIMEFVDIKVRD